MASLASDGAGALQRRAGAHGAAGRGAELQTADGVQREQALQLRHLPAQQRGGRLAVGRGRKKLSSSSTRN